MPRNLDHRVELMFPVEDPAQRRYLMDLLELQLRDNVKARELLPDGTYRRVAPGKKSAELAGSHLRADPPRPGSRRAAGGRGERAGAAAAIATRGDGRCRPVTRGGA